VSWEGLLQELAGPHTPLRASHLARLSDLPPARQQELARLWPSIEPSRRRRIVERLVELSEENLDLDFGAVFLLALQDADPEVRAWGVRGLWPYEDRQTIARLLPLLEGDPEPLVRAEAALALGHFVLLYALGRLREKHFLPIEAALRRAIESPAEAEEVRARALEAMGPCVDRPWVREAIRTAFESGRHRLRVSALHAMGRSGEARWLPLLVRELSSDDPELRYEAALACGAIGDQGAVPHLAPLLQDPDPEVREAAIAALGQIGGREARDLLLPLQQDPSPAVREAVAAALAELEFGEDPFSLRSFLNDQ
jgi:HEAT repeat protein